MIEASSGVTAVLTRMLLGVGFAVLTLAPARAAPPAAERSQFHGAVAKAADVGSVKVAKATGPDAQSVADVVVKGAELNGKPVAVRGKVVKFIPSVMGKNWIHLRDGSGSDADKSNDVVVTTMDETKIGAVVVAKGIVRTDVNLGSGYFYAVLIDDARLQK